VEIETQNQETALYEVLTDIEQTVEDNSGQRETEPREGKV